MLVEKDEARGEAQGDGQRRELFENERPALLGKALDGDADDGHVANPRRVSRPQLLAAQVMIEIHGARRRVEPVQQAGDAELEVVDQLVLPALPAGRVDDDEFAHAAEVEHLDEPVLDVGQPGLEQRDLARVRRDGLGLLLVVIEQVEKPLLTPQRRRVHHRQRVLGLEMRSLALELAAALLVDQRRDRIGEMRRGAPRIVGRGQPGGVDPHRPAAAEPGEDVVDPPAQLIELGRRHAGGVRTVVKPACQQAAVLAQDCPRRAKRGEVQEVGDALGLVPELFQRKHRRQSLRNGRERAG